ncbi:hypothetical protein Tco_0643871 [Tanacetum coccineum]
MSTLTFTDTHYMVAFLEKPIESDGFHEIVDFLNANQIRYALTVNPTIYTSCIEQSDLHLEDAGGTDCLATATIFEELARMGAKSTAWNEFSSTVASLIICLATNQKFNLSNYNFCCAVDEYPGESDNKEKFDIDDLHDDVNVDMPVGEKQEQSVKEREAFTKQEEEANIALIKSWDNTQAMIEANFELAQRLQTKEQGEIPIEERSRLFAARKKILGKKRARKEKQQESSKRQRMKDDKETDKHEVVEEDDEAELKKHLVIVKDDDIGQMSYTHLLPNH